jgi:hypothetical protein
MLVLESTVSNRALRPLPGRLAGPLATVALAVVLGGWLLAAPPGASPDDGYHLASIWCADGFQDGLCVEDVASQNTASALVPQQVLTLACFTYDGSRSAACQVDALQGELVRFVPTETNIDGARPGLYYRAMHALIGDGQDVAGAASRIRIANAALAMVLVLLTAAVADARLRMAFLLSWIVAAVPLGLFLLTSVNTSAWGIAGLTTAWANAITARDHPSTRNRIFAALLAVVGLTLGLGSRTEAVGHVGVIAVALLSMWITEHLEHDRLSRDRRPLLKILAATAGAIMGGFALIAIAPRSAGLDGVFASLADGYGRIAARGVGDPILAIAFEVPTLWAGALGHVWGLGALDTPIPSLASYPLLGVFLGLVAVGLHGGARARTVTVTVLFTSLFVFPTFSLLRAGLLVYEQLQPRQFMVLLFPILGVALYRLRGEADLTLGAAGRVVIVTLLGLSHSVALLVTMQRHTSGLLPGFLGEPRHVGFGREIEWWWTSAPSPYIIWIIASVAYVGLAALVVRLVPPSRRQPDSSDASPRVRLP